MPSSNRWRINITATNGNGYTEIVKLTMAAIPGGPDQCTGGTASASSSYSGQPPGDAFDASNLTWWSTASGQNGIGWLEYQFASPVTVVEYTIKATAAAGYPPKTWTFEYYNGSSWVVVDTRASETGWVANEVRTYTFGQAAGSIAMPTFSIPIGVPTLLAQNVEYALPNRACYLITTANCDISHALGGTYAAHTSGQIAMGNFIKCTGAGGATVTCKRL